MRSQKRVDTLFVEEPENYESVLEYRRLAELVSFREFLVFKRLR